MVSASNPAIQERYPTLEPTSGPSPSLHKSTLTYPGRLRLVPEIRNEDCP